jgi:hypothetical protein
MKNFTEILVDENGFEIIVNYDADISPSQIEEGHGFHEVGNLIYTKLKEVQLVIGDKGTSLLPILDEKQKNIIISKLTYQ